MTTDLPTLRRRLDRAEAVVAVAQQQHAASRALVAEQAQAVEAADVALHAIRAIRDLASARVQQRLTDLATEALRVVFDDTDVSLAVRMVERRGVAEADLVLRRGGLETDPLDSNGGGLVNEISAILRLVMVRMLRPRGVAQLMLLDEPFAALSKNLRPVMAETLRELSAALGIQVLMITHAEEEQGGTIYRVQWRDRDLIEAEIVRVE